MKKLLAMLAITVSSSSFAGLPEMMKIYNNPSSAPQVPACKKNTNCNAFVALGKQWQSIPQNYRYKGKWNIRKDAAEGDGYGLRKGFYLYKEKSVNIAQAGEDAFYDPLDRKSTFSEAKTAQGLAVIMYIEDKNGWTKD